ncbi:sec-independent translocase [Actinoallomurus sp. NPDC052274]|uniref:sec-independent translocase n=1 Tax=Actinoallomurus sp. NPDC052274 TaxID=3155420 RepID=UPI0034191B4E
MFDIGIEKFALLLVLAVIIFGPDQLPRVARQVGQTLRQLRRLAADATGDLKEGLGPEYADLDLADLNPRRFIQKHLLDDLDEPRQVERLDAGLHGGGRAPYDTEAT